MHSSSCANWDYERHPEHAQVAIRCVEILEDLRNSAIEPVATVRDSRPVHRRLFKGLTPSACVYLAGHYRGENFPFLKNYNVFVPMDSRVGVSAIHVSLEMNKFVNIVNKIFLVVDIQKAKKHADISEEALLVLIVKAAAEIHVEFLRIHPYANGNGHIARFMVWSLLGKYGYWPKNWPFDDSPGAPYAELLSKYRDGDQEPLIHLMLRAIAGI